MDAKIVRGNAFGVPVNGSIVSLNNSDVANIVTAASGLAKTLFFVAGGVALATGLAGSYLPLKSNKEHKGMRLDVMSKVVTSKRIVFGSCIDENIKVNCDNEDLEIPIGYIKYIGRREHSIGVLLFDGSVYQISNEPKLNFLTVVGKQRIIIDGNSFLGDLGKGIFGATVNEKELFIDNLENFLKEKDEPIVKLLGKKKFEKFFYPGR